MFFIININYSFCFTIFPPIHTLCNLLNVINKSSELKLCRRVLFVQTIFVILINLTEPLLNDPVLFTSYYIPSYPNLP
jgi:hypothetical protein